MAIIGIVGKKQSGKDTVGKIIQYLIATKTYGSRDLTLEGLIEDDDKYISFSAGNGQGGKRSDTIENLSTYKTVRFADKLKDMVCLLIGCTREQLEDEEFKNKPLGEEWVRYAYAIGFGDRDGHRIMWSNTCSKEKYEEQRIANWQTAYKATMTPRYLLQLLGTECGRNTIHHDIWVNATMVNYKDTRWINYADYYFEKTGKWHEYYNEPIYPNWIIPDVRFPNEVKAIEDRKGLMIKVIRPLAVGTKFKTTFDDKEYTVLEVCPDLKLGGTWFYEINDKHEYVRDHNVKHDEHASETALDDHEFIHTIYNDGSIDDLVAAVHGILIDNKII